MTSNQKSRIEIDYQQWSGFFKELQSESDRGATILASVWIEHLLERKLSTLFSKGNAAAQRRLFEYNGPFSAFSSKIDTAYCLGWIDSDAFHDINLVRKIRNRFAHELHGIALESSEIRLLIDQFNTPKRYYDDWDDFRAVASADGTSVILHTGDPPDEAGDALDIQRIKYQRVISLLVAEVAASLGLAIRVEKS